MTLELNYHIADKIKFLEKRGYQVTEVEKETTTGYRFSKQVLKKKFWYITKDGQQVLPLLSQDDDEYLARCDRDEFVNILFVSKFQVELLHLLNKESNRISL